MTSCPMEKIESANQEALRRMLAGDPVLVDVIPASEAIPDLREHIFLHAGPPIEWARMCGPMRGAVTGIAVFEGWAPDLEVAADMAAAGVVRAPMACFEQASVGFAETMGVS